MQSKDNEKTKLAPKKPSNLKIIGLILIIFLGIVFVYHNKSANNDCTEGYRQDTLIQTPSGQEIAVEIADTVKSQTKGLSGKVCINEQWGMLFSFNQEEYRYFWMKDMNFALDIIWLDGNKRVVDVTKDVQPSTYPETFTSKLPAQYVLEIPAGHADEFGLQSSAQVNF